MLSVLRPYGVHGTITSGIRSTAQQAALYANRANNPYPVARPGTSLHEQGRAVDVSASPEVLRYLAGIWKGWGGRWGGDFQRPDPVHFEY